MENIILGDKPLENNLVAFLIGRNVIELCRGGKYKNGNPKRASRWICIKCLKENRVGDGIQRRGHQREKYHVKDLACLCTDLKEQTKNLEVRWCDSFQEMMEVAKELHREYYERAV